MYKFGPNDPPFTPNVFLDFSKSGTPKGTSDTQNLRGHKFQTWKQNEVALVFGRHVCEFQKMPLVLEKLCETVGQLNKNASFAKITTR